MTKKILSVTLAVLILCAALFGCSKKEDKAQSASGGAFSAVSLDGRNIDESIFGEAKLTVVNIWGTFCSPCIEELPSLGSLSRKYEKDGVRFIGIVGDTYDATGTNIVEAVVKNAEEIVEQTKADYLHIIPDASMYRRLLGEIMAFPTTYFVDENGSAVGSPIVGALSEEKWEKEITERLKAVK